MPDSEVVRVMRQFKRDLLRLERAQLRDMAQRWLTVERRLQAQIDALALEMADRRRDGRTITAEMLLNERRYRELLVQLTQELERYSDYAERTITDRQRQLARLGIDHAENALTVQGVSAGFNRLPVESVEAMAGLAGNGAPLRQLLAQSWPLAADGLTNELVTSVALGYNPRKVARLMAQGATGSLDRMMVIARTEQLRVYRFANRESYRTSGVVTGYKRLATHDSRVCAACLMDEGTLYEVGEEMPVHPQCVIEGTFVSTPQVIGTSKRFYDGPVFDIVTAGGNHLAVTPNHPVLTSKGWIAACLLKEGDCVVSSRHSNGATLLVAPDNQHRPSLIENIVDAFGKAGDVSTVSMPIAPEDFHGDGIGSDVAVVGANRFLQSSLDAALIEPSGELSFFVRSMGRADLLSSRAVTQFGKGAGATYYGSLGDLNAAVMFLNRRLRREQLIGLGVAANSDAGFQEPQTDHISTCPVCGRESVLGLTRDVAVNNFANGQTGISEISINAALGQIPVQRSATDALTLKNDFRLNTSNVVLDRIVDLSSRQFSGHVYNLQTVTGWYVANGIITHNCRCTLVPVVEGMRQPTWTAGADWFVQQSPARQQAILGQGRYSAWQAGDFDLDAVVTVKPNLTWGASLQVTPLRELVGA